MTETTLRDAARVRRLRAMQLHDEGDNRSLFDAGWNAALEASGITEALENIRSAASALNHPALCIIDSMAADALAKIGGEA